jgi:hypothetical protein
MYLICTTFRELKVFLHLGGCLYIVSSLAYDPSKLMTTKPFLLRSNTIYWSIIFVDHNESTKCTKFILLSELNMKRLYDDWSSFIPNVHKQNWPPEQTQHFRQTSPLPRMRFLVPKLQKSEINFNLYPHRLKAEIVHQSVTDSGYFLKEKYQIKSVPLHAMVALGGERKYSSYSFLTSALDKGEWSASRPGRVLPRGKDPR